MRSTLLSRVSHAAFFMGSTAAISLGLPAHAATYPALPRSPQAVAPNDLFGTAALFAPLGKYQEQWDRAKQSAVAHPRLQALIEPARGLSPGQQVAFVQDQVHRQIRWMSDATEWSRHDYWASAAETLSHGAGDMEDRAILKMQALIALGFDPADLYLTLGKDKVGGEMAMLVVRLGSGDYLTLDDLGGAPVAASRRDGFTPMFSVSTRGQWLHGYRVAARAGATARPRSR